MRHYPKRRETNTLVLNADCRPKGFLPLSTTSWQEAIRLVWSGTASVMHEYDDWEVHSPRLTMKVPSVIILSKYVNLKKHVPWSKENLKMRDDYTCQYCRTEFPSSMLTFDHVKPFCKGGATNWENIVAACSPCNNKRGSNSNIRPAYEPYKPTYWEMVEKRKKYPLWVPEETWVPYLDWPEELIKIPNRKF
jgi:5-methylcytosine-specific restriction endonuclease McrA